MMIRPARLASFILFAALAAAAVGLRLGPALLAALFSYTLLDAAHRKLAARVRPLYARWLTLSLFAAAAVLLAFFSVRFLRQSLSTVPAILVKAAPKLADLAERYGIDLPLDNAEELRQAALGTLKENLKEVTHASGLLSKGFLRVAMAVSIAVLCFAAHGRGTRGGSLYDALSGEFGERTRRFMRSFELVLGAQVLISGVNTVLTAAFLLALGFPYAAFLIPATFILGLLPLIGSILSNTIIVGTALTISARHAAFALGFLVLIHKGEYLLNSRIIGSSIKAPMWQTLLGILLGEMILGVPGIILAPAALHYVRRELEDIAYPAE